MIFTGSRVWGDARDDMPQEWIDHELEIGTAAVSRLIGRWVIGISENFKKRDRSAPPGPGLTMIVGDARGADTHVANAARIFAAGLKRRSRAEYLTPASIDGEELAIGLSLETYWADWDHLGLAAGGLRNQEMLDSGADHVIALFAHGKAYGPGIRGGTNDMVRRATAAGVPVDIYVCNDRRWRKP